MIVVWLLITRCQIRGPCRSDATNCMFVSASEIESAATARCGRRTLLLQWHPMSSRRHALVNLRRSRIRDVGSGFAVSSVTLPHAASIEVQPFQHLSKKETNTHTALIEVQMACVGEFGVKVVEVVIDLGEACRQQSSSCRIRFVRCSQH